MRQPSRCSTLFVAIMLALSAGAGCSELAKPRDRIGALPFPGRFTLYYPGDLDHLGEHRYERTPRFFHTDESAGIFYTTRAGFIDVAHLRITVDYVRYCTSRIRSAIKKQSPTVRLATIEGSVFYIDLHDLPESLADDDAFADELALRIGQRVSYLMMTWHEVLTWFGYRTVVFADEAPSAFTWDDSMSHVVGLRIAGRVLRDSSDGSFDERVTRALRAELIDLGAMPPSETDRAAMAVEGKWWSHGGPLKRQVDIGLTDDVVHPWLVPGFSSAHDPAEAFHLPTLKDVCGHDLSNSYSVRIDPIVSASTKMRRLIPSHPAFFDDRHDVPLLIEAMRQQMREKFAADVDRPWPTVAATQPAHEPSHLTLAPTPSRHLRER